MDIYRPELDMLNRWTPSKKQDQAAASHLKRWCQHNPKAAVYTVQLLA